MCPLVDNRIADSKGYSVETGHSRIGQASKNTSNNPSNRLARGMDLERARRRRLQSPLLLPFHLPNRGPEQTPVRSLAQKSPLAHWIGASLGARGRRQRGPHRQKAF